MASTLIQLSRDPSEPSNGIAKLPIEILATIFIYSLPFPNRAPDNVALQSQSPLLLTEVCVGWRDLALSTSELWTSLIITERFLRQTDARSLAFMEQMLESPELINTLALLTAPTKAIRDAALIAGVWKWFSRASDRPLSLALNFCPVGFQRYSDCRYLPWGRLSHLVIQGPAIPPHDIVKILQQSHNLVTCKIDGITCEDSFPAEAGRQNPICLPRLTSLKLIVSLVCPERQRAIERSAICIFLRQLELPALERLEVDGQLRLRDNWCLAQILLHKTPKTYRPITHLRLEDISVDLQELWKFLTATPTLQHLHLSAKPDEHQDYAALIGCFSYHTGALIPNDLPRLETLIIEDNLPDTSVSIRSDKAILHMVATRRWRTDSCFYKEENLAQLKELHVYWRKMPSMKVWNTVAYEEAVRLQSGGLKIWYPSLSLFYRRVEQ